MLVSFGMQIFWHLAWGQTGDGIDIGPLSLWEWGLRAPCNLEACRSTSSTLSKLFQDSSDRSQPSLLPSGSVSRQPVRWFPGIPEGALQRSDSKSLL